MLLEDDTLLSEWKLTKFKKKLLISALITIFFPIIPLDVFITFFKCQFHSKDYT